VDRLTVPANLDSLDDVAEYVAEAAAASGVDSGQAYHLRLAADEIVTNIIKHGYGGDDRGEVELAARCGAGRLEIEISDSAPPFDPLPHLAPPEDLASPLTDRAVGGLGLYLAAQGVDEFLYERCDGRNRNTLVVHVDPERRGG